MRRALSFPAQGWAGNLSVESSRPSKGTVGLMCRPVRDEFRVPATERFGNVAVPANGPVGGQGLLKMFQRNLIPLEGLALLVYDGGRMIMPMDFAKRLVTVKASPAFVPATDDVGDQARLRRLLNLRQTLLATTRHSGPPRAFAQLKMGSSNGRLDGGFCCRYPHGRWPMIFRAADDSVPAKLAVSAKRAEKPKNNDDEGPRHE